MKILMLGWELPPHNSGGLGVACYQLCKALSKRNIDIDFVLPYTTDEKPSFMNVISSSPIDGKSALAMSVIYESEGYLNSEYTQFTNFAHQQRSFEENVMKLVEIDNYDVIHAHDWLTFRAALKAKQRKNLPLIAHVHSIESDRAGGNPGNPFVREIEEITFLIADCVVTVSERTKEAICREYNIPRDKIKVVHNCIDKEELQMLDDANAYTYLDQIRKQGYKVIVSVGRLTIQKGLSNLITTMREVVAIYPKTMLLIVGSGEQYNDLVKTAADCGVLKNVIFTGFQRGKHWRDSFGVGDIFVMPSVSEPFGLTPLEAANYHLPSVISRQSGVTEVFKNCLKVDFWDSREMTNKILGVLNNPGLKEDLANNAYNELDSINWDNSAEKIHNLYDSKASLVTA
jgi:glycosyltransferase involved in cell wall biosynthesis